MYLLRASLRLLIIFIPVFVSCELSDDAVTKITLIINCAGGEGQGFTFDLIADDYVLSNSSTGNFTWVFDDIKTLTITATKSYDDASLEIFILKDEKVVQTGFLNANYPSASDVTNTLTVIWKENSTKAGATDSSSSSTSNSTTGTTTGSE
jgi:hypothetical protein